MIQSAPIAGPCEHAKWNDTPGTLAGHLHLRAEIDAGGRTFLARQSFRAPFHISKPYWDGHALQVQMVNPTSGMLEGDDLELQAEAGPGSKLLLTTPAAARACVMRHGAAECRQSLRVEPGGWLEYSPETLYPHRDCNYRQLTEVEVSAGAGLYYADSLAPGRIGRGECWQWRRLQLALMVTCEGEPILRERLDCSGSEMRLQAERHRQPVAWHGTIIVVSGCVSPDNSVWTAIRNLHRDNLWIGATRLRQTGWIIRVVAPSGIALRDAFSRIRSLLKPALPALCSDPRKL